MERNGTKTSEWMITVLTTLAIVALIIAEGAGWITLPEDVVKVLSGAITVPPGAYAISRGLAKSGS